MQMRVGKGGGVGGVSEMPKMGLERAGEKEREEVGVHDGLDMSKVSLRAANSQLVYLTACFAVSKRKQLNLWAGSRAVPNCHLPSRLSAAAATAVAAGAAAGELNLVYFIPLERGQTVAI